MKLPRKNIAVLATCQALLFANNSTVIAVNGLAGYALASNKAIATLPVTGWVFGAALATYPASLLMKRLGRRAGFHLGAAIGMAGAAICAAAVYLASFWLLCFGTLVFGAYNGVAQYYRFAAADASPAEYRSTAISLVLGGGLVGGLIGPELSKLTVDLFQAKYLGAYLSLMGYLVLVMLVLTLLRIPPPTEEEQRAAGRPLRDVVAQPQFVVAVLGAAFGFGVMNLLMVATPLAMGFCGHPYSAAALVIQWHIIGMFAPSFFTGALIRRLGVLNVMFIGALLLYVCVAIALAGVSVANFWFSLTILGIGWNFLYIGGTTLLTGAYAPSERAKAQGFNDLMIFLTQAVTSIASGWLLDASGWETLNYLAVPFITAIGVAVLWLMLKRRAALAA